VVQDAPQERLERYRTSRDTERCRTPSDRGDAGHPGQQDREQRSGGPVICRKQRDGHRARRRRDTRIAAG
jgi:hypothetical protein